jgi:hypothetical protein
MLMALAVLTAGCGDAVEIRPDAAAFPDVSVAPAIDAAPEVARDAAEASVDAVGADQSAADSAISPDAKVDGPAADVVPSMPDAAVDVGVDDSSQGPLDQASDGGACTAPGCPSMLAPDHLQLWLRGDEGVECVEVDGTNRVMAWRDRSPKGNDALVAAGKHGPLCGAGMIGDRPVVTFPRTPGLEAEEHFEVNLSSLLDHSFTIAFVDRRPAARAPSEAWVFGSKLPYPEGIQCDGVSPDNAQGLAIGYGGPPALFATVWGPDCEAQANVGRGDDSAHLTVVTFSPTSGLTLFRDGASVSTAASEGLKATMGGYLGRGYQSTPGTLESRFLGDLAEVVVLDEALETPARQALEVYLQARWNTARRN